MSVSSAGSGEGHDGGGAESCADGADSAGPQYGLSLARCRTVSNQDSQRTAAHQTGEVLDRFANVGSVIDGGVAQARFGACHRRKGGVRARGNDQLVIGELHAVHCGDNPCVGVNEAGRLPEPDRDLGEFSEFQQGLRALVSVAENSDGSVKNALPGVGASGKSPHQSLGRWTCACNDDVEGRCGRDGGHVWPFRSYDLLLIISVGGRFFAGVSPLLPSMADP